MKFNQWMLTGMVSAMFIAGSATAQVKKAPAKKPVSPKPATTAKPATSVAKLSSTQDSVSYSIGVFMAQNLKQQGITDLNDALLMRGLEDALKDKTLLLSQDQCGQVMNSFMQKQMAVRNAEGMKASAENKKAGSAFLAENKAKTGVVTTTSGLQYTVEKEGTGPKPTATDRVRVHYTGRLLDGKVFDSSVERGQPAEFGVNEVIKGWTEALQLMPVGSKWKLYIPSELAYGDRGAGADIKPGSTLVFDVELLDLVKSAQAEPEADKAGPQPVKSNSPGEKKNE
ncbi:FKBP-type peptidyl-prolyl cis-trans isomerase [Spirosoma luteum]|uniref:FKBP-type peptidyl-prolyl cis-trans isomerase n=1 Tax=Spirosoma luteum TaxID=431553 RepID=UPI003CCBC416